MQLKSYLSCIEQVTEPLNGLALDLEYSVVSNKGNVDLRTTAASRLDQHHSYQDKQTAQAPSQN